MPGLGCGGVMDTVDDVIVSCLVIAVSLIDSLSFDEVGIDVFGIRKITLVCPRNVSIALHGWICLIVRNIDIAKTCAG